MIQFDVGENVRRLFGKWAFHERHRNQVHIPTGGQNPGHLHRVLHVDLNRLQ